MRRQSRVSASHVPLMVLWKKPQVTALLAQRVSMSVQLLLPLARDCAVMGQQQMQAWRERLWPNLRTQKRLCLDAFSDKEYAVTLRALLNLACARLTLLRCPLRGSLQREAALCQR
jgi:uncharacterized protein (DUF2236 family)